MSLSSRYRIPLLHAHCFFNACSNFLYGVQMGWISSCQSLISIKSIHMSLLCCLVFNTALWNNNWDYWWKKYWATSFAVCSHIFPNLNYLYCPNNYIFDQSKIVWHSNNRARQFTHKAGFNCVFIGSLGILHNIPNCAEQWVIRHWGKEWQIRSDPGVEHRYFWISVGAFVVFGMGQLQHLPQRASGIQLWSTCISQCIHFGIMKNDPLNR